MNERDKRIADQRLVAIGQLGAGIIHEVRNLVTSIRGFAQVAAGVEGDPQRVKDLLGTIDNESARVVDHLNEFLSFVRVPSRSVEQVDLNEMVAGAWRLVRHDLHLHQVRGELALADTPPMISGNFRELQQVLVNLFLNARDAMPEGGEVVVTTSIDADGKARIAVADSGHGVPPENRERVFEPLFTTKPVGQGTGLGLAVCRQLVTDNRGEIWVEDRDGGGAVFITTFPAAGGSE